VIGESSDRRPRGLGIAIGRGERRWLGRAGASDLASAGPGRLVERAGQGDKSALDDAVYNRALYDEVLNTLVAQVDSAAMLLSLVSYVTRNGFPVNKALAQNSIDYWKGSLDRNSTAKLLHITALSDDAQIYGQAVDVVLDTWREGKLQDVSAEELLALFTGEFWVLSSNTRSSGAGFVLKRTLSAAKRELEPTNNQI